MPEGHPWHQKSYYEIEKMDSYPEVHGGLTFSGVFEEIEPDTWWVGFDMAHIDDFDDNMNRLSTMNDCVAETNKLAEQAVKAAKADG